MSLLDDARERLASVEARIARAAGRAGREAREITLVGVAKRQPLERIVATVEAGLRVLGENFVQEARDTRDRLASELGRADGRPATALEWRMVGRLQRNKLALAVRVFDVIESVDRIELIAPLARLAAEADRILDVLIQINVGEEPQKGGASFEDAPALARAIAGEPALRLRGFMAVPPASEDPEASRTHFRRLRTWRDAWAAGEPGCTATDLSMGMSNDFEVAIEEGATLVRVGTALFGPRIDPR
jgi:pyridoxal phosphate enzyme (YggS family)